MKAISFFDDHYPVRTLYSDKEDWKVFEDWGSSEGRKGIIESRLKVPVSEICYAREKHTGSVALVGDRGRISVEHIEERHILGTGTGYDSLVTAVRGIMLCIWTADCLPLYIYDTENHAAAMVHCGWRGTCSRIASNTLAVMKRCFGTEPGRVVAAFGPSICGSCYEVGPELIDYFSETFPRNEVRDMFRPSIKGKYLFDNRRAVSFDLDSAGVRPETVYDTGICTFEAGRYASYRRDGKAGREKQMLSGIMLI